MTRVDVPTLMCDRCGHQTQDTREMMSFYKLEHTHMSGREDWDLCKECKLDYLNFFIKNYDLQGRAIPVTVA